MRWTDGRVAQGSMLSQRLDDDTRIGLGHRRECHAYPGRSSRCIKIARDPSRSGRADQNAVEWRNFVALERRGVPMRHIAHCYGWLRTQRGPGLVCERIRNTNGSFSRTLDEELARGGVGVQHALALLAELRRWALEFAVVIADLRSTNLMLRQGDKDSHLVFIDGLGGRRVDRNFVLRQRVAWLARIKTRRQWRRQWPATEAVIHRLGGGRDAI